ncbi:eCIS core domain-containing protein [Chitinophaga sp. 22321]|uniref:DUF4157 domain-containing protein n=1 Tax=Chitinophaga hostae TaxID=2831022 RepID=A0ABS5JB45_9BACT|nr:DUF4157 domain-containing protein [Chitinophaga hostae]MBS0032290.1 DUF4157 domain-containing protein [Chitinophaga hostae]
MLTDHHVTQASAAGGTAAANHSSEGGISIVPPASPGFIAPTAAGNLSSSPVQFKSNRTGMPDKLKNGIESMSGLAMDDVRVHYNSDQPAQMNALAYAQGTDIHIASGQEEHLPHEAWHVVQQKQGRVPVTRQMKSIGINDDTALEREADAMGAKAWHAEPAAQPLQRMPVTGSVTQMVRRTGLFGVEAEVLGGVFVIRAEKGSEGQNLIESENITLEEFKLGVLNGKVDVTLDNEVKADLPKFAHRQYVIEFVQKAVDFQSEDLGDLKQVAIAWKLAADFWRASKDNDNLLKGKIPVEWYTLNPRWKGGQFDNGDQPHPGVTATGDGPQKEFEFDWQHHAFESFMSIKDDDPEVSVQATLGSSLSGIVEAYALSSHILRTGEPDEAFWADKDTGERRRMEIEKPGTMALTSLFFMLKTYINAMAGSQQKRYAKEYLGFMSRTSLDMAYSLLPPNIQQLFVVMVSEYIWNKPGNQLTKTLGKAPDARVFTPDTTKEPQAHDITIEQMLLSMINRKKGDIPLSLAAGEEHAAGDVFSENKLAGISEINPGAPEAIEKFKLNAANEMMKGEPGIIFESRSAREMKLSQMPELYTTLLTSLKKMDELYKATEQTVKEEKTPKPVVPPAAKKETCLLM